MFDEATSSSPALDFDVLYTEFAAIVQDATNQQEETKVPTSVSGGYCDDLLDYWDPDTQHPVGYHPTTACSDSETNVRGFEAWMSADEHGSWAIDPVRMRNSTLASLAYGGSHMVCDASAYEAEAVYFNDFHLNSQWSPNAKADPAVPGQASGEWEDGVEGLPSADYLDTPLVYRLEAFLQHSAKT